MRQQNIFQTPPWMRLCLIQTTLPTLPFFSLWICHVVVIDKLSIYIKLIFLLKMHNLRLTILDTICYFIQWSIHYYLLSTIRVVFLEALELLLLRLPCCLRSMPLFHLNSFNDIMAWRGRGGVVALAYLVDKNVDKLPVE